MGISFVYSINYSLYRKSLFEILIYFHRKSMGVGKDESKKFGN